MALGTPATVALAAATALGLDIELAPADLLEVTGGIVAAIARS